MARGWEWPAVLLALALGRPVNAAPLETYGRLPFIEAIRLSPDGKMVAYVATDGEKRRVIVRQIKLNKVLSWTDAGEIKVRDLQWAGSNHLIITTSSTGLVQGLSGPREEWYLATDLNLAKIGWLH